MLKTLELSNFAIVDSLSIDLSPGLNVLTGETGAGKSILMDALALLIGGRADSSWVRSGSDRALIQGIFADELSASRTISVNGRSTARLDGELVTVSDLSETLADRVALHGQHASQVLLNSNEQRKLLDRLLPEKSKIALGNYRELYTEYQQISKTLTELQEKVRERARRIDVLSFQLEEIDAAKLKLDELESLSEQLESQRYAERITSLSGNALSVLSEADINAVGLLSDAQKDLDNAGRYNKTLASLANELTDAMASIEAISQEVYSFLSDFELEPGLLEKLEDRLSLIENLQRKYGDTIPGILAYREEAAQELARLQHADEDMASLETEKQEFLQKLHNLAESISQARQKVAKDLAKRVTQEVKPLGMDNAQFAVEVKAQTDLSPHGKDSITYLFSANLGENPAPLAAVASGGELSRVMLALNVVTGSDLPILAFDEVDAGIGGKTARAVGRLLKQLAEDHQILVVTHLPQVAAFADTQFYVEKQEKEGRTVTKVNRLEPHERELELARMLSGNISDASVANARELLQESI
ncbi:MAG: DNA repair protein RecN [Trueperaceae bacterium]|nr:DNA repair protein RecN [Trueperaceae bacterium]